MSIIEIVSTNKGTLFSSLRGRVVWFTFPLFTFGTFLGNRKVTDDFLESGMLD